MTANPLSSELLALAAKVEALTGPDGATDEAIHAAIKGVTIEWQEYAKRNAYHRDGRWVSIGPVPPYCASLDSAMTLCPSECVDWLFRRFDDGKIGCDLEIIGVKIETVSAEAFSHASSLTAASLRAIAAQQGEGS